MAANRDLADFEDIADLEVTSTAPPAAGPSSSTATDGKEVMSRDPYVDIRASGFRDLVLRSEIERAIQDQGFEHPSEVQYTCIPQAMLGSDILCQAKSGMGKTAVYVIAILQQLEESVCKSGKCLCVVLVPTHELAYQALSDFTKFAKYMPFVKFGVFVGKIPLSENAEELRQRQPTVAIGCPGRMMDVIERRLLKVDSVRFFVVDECDRMLGAEDRYSAARMSGEVDRVYSALPKTKQVMMFSATIDEQLRPKLLAFMNKPQDLRIDPPKLILHGLKQYHLKILEEQKNRKLTDLLDQLRFGQVIIFVKSTERCEALTEMLRRMKFPVIGTHARLPEKERRQRFTDFREGRYVILVATDLMERGVDFERVDLVINFDMPKEYTTYHHRVGRAGRFGTKGVAISFVVAGDDETVLDQVQKHFEMKIELLPSTSEDKAFELYVRPEGTRAVVS